MRWAGLRTVDGHIYFFFSRQRLLVAISSRTLRNSQRSEGLLDKKARMEVCATAPTKRTAAQLDWTVGTLAPGGYRVCFCPKRCSDTWVSVGTFSVAGTPPAEESYTVLSFRWYHLDDSRTTIESRRIWPALIHI